MSEQASTPAPPLDPLHGELRDLIAASRQRLAATVNAELTRLYWRIGQRLASEVLRGERAPDWGRYFPRRQLTFNFQSAQGDFRRVLPPSAFYLRAALHHLRRGQPAEAARFLGVY